MPAIGLNLKLINASKTGEVTGPVNISNRTKIKGVTEKNLPSLGKDGLLIEFVFYADYKSKEDKNLAVIEIEGEVFFVGDDQKDVKTMWDSQKKLPDNVNIDILNIILRKCLTKSLQLSEDLQLPPPIALPFATTKGSGEQQAKGVA